MRIGAAITASIGRALAPIIKAAVPVMNARNTWALIREPFTGAWQKNAEIDNREALLAFAAVYACVSRIANDIGKLRIKLVEFDSSLGIWTEVGGPSPFWPVLRKPNRYQNRIQFLIEWVVMKLTHGNAYILKQRDARGVVNALYVLDSRRVRPMVATDGGVYYQISSDQLAGIPNGITVPAGEVIHDRGPTLWHPLFGVSPIYACGASATQGNRIQAHGVKFFENMARPSGQLTAPGTIDEVTALRLKADFEANFSGGNLGRLFVAGDGLKYEPMSIPANDAQLIEQLRWTAEDVARAFAMPLYKIGAGPVPTSNNVEALQQQYYTDCLQVLIESIELCLDEGLALGSVEGRTLGTELDLDGLLRMDSMTQIQVLSEGVKGGLVKPNEGRGKLGLRPVAGGDQVYLQQQNYSLAALAKRDARDDPFSTTAPAAPPAAPSAAPQPNSEAKALEAAAEFADELIRRFTLPEHAG